MVIENPGGGPVSGGCTGGGVGVFRSCSASAAKRLLSCNGAIGVRAVMKFPSCAILVLLLLLPPPCFALSFLFLLVIIHDDG